jgi:chromosome segregation ATPase
MNADLEGKDKDSQEYKDLKAQIAEKETAVNNLKTASDKAEQDKKDAQTALDKKKNGGGEPKPKEKTKEEIDAELEAIDKEYKQKDKALDDEYKEKIDNETDETKKQQLQDELAKKKKSLKAEMNKKKDDVDDNDTHDTQNDETKKGKYTVAEEEIEDPKTGKKIKVKTYTGPRGGKFYYPEGAPHTPEHKVYLESLTLSQYMFEIFS